MSLNFLITSCWKDFTVLSFFPLTSSILMVPLNPIASFADLFQLSSASFSTFAFSTNFLSFSVADSRDLSASTNRAAASLLVSSSFANPSDFLVNRVGISEILAPISFNLSPSISFPFISTILPTSALSLVTSS